MLYHFEYLTQRSKSERRLELSDRTQEFLKDLTHRRMKSELSVFKIADKTTSKALGDSISMALEQTLRTTEGFLANKSVRALYKVMRRAIMCNEQAFTVMSDRKDFFKQLVINPAIELGMKLQVLH